MSAQFTSIIFCPLSHSVSFLQFSSSNPDIGCFLSTSTSWFFWLHVEAQGERELKEKAGCRNSQGKEWWKHCTPKWLISYILSKKPNKKGKEKTADIERKAGKSKMLLNFYHARLLDTFSTTVPLPSWRVTLMSVLLRHGDYIQDKGIFFSDVKG